MNSALCTVERVARIFHLKPVKANGKIEWHGANPTGNGATHDGFILYPEGNAFDRKANVKYTSREVAEMAGIKPEEYEPYFRHKAQAVITSSRTESFRLTNSQNQGVTTKKTSSGPLPDFDWKKAKIFEYLNESGSLVFRVGRIDYPNGQKDFRQQQLDGAGRWLGSLTGVQRIPFNLPDVVEAENVIWCEGEQVAVKVNEDLKEAGLYGLTVATTTAQGSSSFHLTDVTALHGKNIVILPDNDTPGEKYRDAILKALEPHCTIKVIDLPNRGEGGDYIDFCKAGGSLDGLVEMVDEMPEWEPPKPPQDFTTYTFKDLAKLPQRKSLIRGQLYEGDSSVLSGDSGTFKSFFALDEALCVATGKDFHGREVKQGTVVYVAAEGFHTMRERAVGWSITHNIELPDNFHILDAPVAILNTVELEKFATQIEKLKPVFIVLDTLSQCAAGANENDNGEMARFVGGMMALARRIGAHVQTLHHNAKSTGTLRGASSIKANIDTQISLERPEDGEENVVFVRCEKQRGRPFENFSLRGQIVPLPIEDEFGDTIDTLVFEECGEVAAIRKEGKARNKRLAATHEKLMAAFDIAAEDGEKFGGGVITGAWMTQALEKSEPPICSKSSFFNHLNTLKDMGVIEEYDQRAGKPIYRRTPTTLTTPTNSGWSGHNSNSNNSNNPLGVGVVGVMPDKTEKISSGHKTTPTRKQKAAGDSEPYAASLIHLPNAEVF